MKISKQNRKGFTLVELLVVIAILGILAAIAIPRFSDASATARGAKVVADLRTIDSAIALSMAQNNGTLPAAITTDVATLTTAAHLLASTPTPPAGEVIIQGGFRYGSVTAYKIDRTNGRATATITVSTASDKGALSAGDYTVNQLLTNAN